MTLPTWNGEPVGGDDPRIVSLLAEAPEVLNAAMSAPGSIVKLGPGALLHAVEAASWLERYSEAARHTLVPAAKASGASWAQLGRAMGVSRATAQHRFRQEADEWEKALIPNTAPHAWDTVPTLNSMELPAGFSPGDEDFARHDRMPTWVYTGELEPAIQLICATHSGVKVWSEDDVYYVMSDSVRPDSGVPAHTATSADSKEDAWRAHIGSALVQGRPYADEAEPGETLAQLKSRLSS